MPRRSPLEGLPAQRYRVADLDVDLGRACVLRDGTEIPLPRLSFDLLVALVQVAPNLASYEHLMQSVWPGVVVGPETVSQRVKLLREALGDAARDPRYVGAVRGRGYRLIPPVVPLADDATPTAIPPPPPTTTNDAAGRPMQVAANRPIAAVRRRRPLGAWGVAALVVGGLGVLVASAALLARRDEGPGTARTAAVTVAPADGATAVAAGPSVAVLPFERLGPEDVETYVALGIAETILGRLSSVRSLDVVARSSSFALETSGLDAPTIGRRLRARYLVQGSVQRSGDRLRVAVQTVDATTGRQLNAVRLERPYSALFELQDEVAGEIARALDVQARGRSPGTSSRAAYVAYLRGLERLGRWRVADADKAAALFAEARALDAQFAAAYVGEAQALRKLRLLRTGDFSVTPEIERLAQRALELDPELASAYVLRGTLTRDPRAAEADLRRGIELAPGDASAYLALGELLSTLPGRGEDAVDVLARAAALDPLQPRAPYLRAIVLYGRNGSDEAFDRALREVLQVDPEYPSALTRLGLLQASAFGRSGEGLALLERAVTADPTAWFVASTAAEIYLALGYTEEAAKLARSRVSGEALQTVIALRHGDAQAVASLAIPGRDSSRSDARQLAALGTLSELAAVIALRDEALRSGRVEEGVRALLDHHCRPDDPPPGAAARGPAPRNCVSAWTLPGAVVLAELEAARGRRTEADRIARAVLTYADSEAARRLPHPYVAANRARAFGVLGRWDDALAALASAQQAKAGLLGWWVIARDSLFDPVRADPRYVSIARAAERRIATERATYERLRRAGGASVTLR
jgi:TolB-like protein/DNA-binding winged helix-turn-helix (wHTH) protein